MLCKTVAAGALLLVVGAPTIASSQQPPVVFTGASVIPMDREAVLTNQTVIVENGRITYVGAPISAPPGATTVDARGKFLMPAIAEFHAHVPSGTQAVHAHRTFLLGSDAPQLWNVPGFAAHRELGALVDAGLSPYQARRTWIGPAERGRMLEALASP